MALESQDGSIGIDSEYTDATENEVSCIDLIWYYARNRFFSLNLYEITIVTL